MQTERKGSQRKTELVVILQLSCIRINPVVLKMGGKPLLWDIYIDFFFFINGKNGSVRVAAEFVQDT